MKISDLTDWMVMPQTADKMGLIHLPGTGPNNRYGFKNVGNNRANETLDEKYETLLNTPEIKKEESKFTAMELAIMEGGFSIEPDHSREITQLQLEFDDFQGKEITDQDLQQLEMYADRLFASLGIDVAFSKHFRDRVNDPRNKKPITMAELTRLFKQIYRQHGRAIAQLGPDAEAVMKDMKTDVNVPFALEWDGKELDLVAKTVIRKHNFATPNPEFSVENFDDGKKPGRKGLAKRMGVNCKQSVSKLRQIASKSSGEKSRMAHWCANMKSGRAKKK